MYSFKQWLILGVVSSALLLIVMDSTILYTALPSLTYDLGASASEKLWILNGYSLVMAGLLPAMGTLGDRYGHKKIFALGLLVFTATSLLAAFAPSPTVLVVARVLLAIGASMMMPATLSIIRMTFTDPRELGLAIGIWAAIASGGAGAGPIIGGFLVEHYWWGAAFLINVPIALLAFILTMVYVPGHEGNKDTKWDITGSVQIMVSMVAIVFAIKEFAKRDGSPALAAVSTIIGIVVLLIFIRRQLRSSTPLLDLSLFKISPFTAGCITAVVGLFGQLGIQYIVTQRLQLVEQLSPLQAGFITLSVPAAALVAGPLIGKIIHLYNVIRLKSLSLLIATVGTVIYLFQYDAGIAGQITGLALLGAGLGAGMTAASHSIMSSAPPEKAGMAASIEEVAYEVGGATGIAIVGSLSGLMYSLSMIIPEGLQVPANVKDSLDEALLVAEDLPVQASEALRAAGRAAFDESFSFVLVGLSVFFALAALAMEWMIARSRKL
ncbi:MFS transporter [Brevibacillus sp. SAFN-007a]|uniref:MFS transporter n=1 Tax=Brevibacillus sp. SAFN-007a TaxID=3436862 RepID=UPI003F8131B1